MRFGLLFLAAAFHWPVAAQMFSPNYGVLGAPASNFLNSSYLTQRLINQQAFRPKAGPSSSAVKPALVQPRAGIGQISAGPVTMPAKLAEHYPSAHRAEAQRLFARLLDGYAGIERQFGIPRHDLAGAVAAFLAGGYMGYRNVDFPDSHFPALVNQVRGILLSEPRIAAAPDAEKQEMYEQMAILGMFLATTQMALKSNPNAQAEANMRSAAKGYLEQFLKADPDRLVLTDQGLVLR